VDGLQRQGHHGDLPSVQQAGDLQAGGAAVEQDGLAVRDEPGHLGRDPALGVDSLVGAQREGRLLAPQQQGARPAADALEDACAASVSRSRRMVISEAPVSSASSGTVALPSPSQPGRSAGAGLRCSYRD
jgi:hypothetical protein